MAQQLYYSAETAMWLQFDCGDARGFLGCHNLTGVSVPRGDRNPSYCRVDKSEFEIKRTYRGEPGLGSATIVAYDSVLNYIQELPCPFNLYVFHSAEGGDEDPSNYDYMYIYEYMEPSSEDTDTHSTGIAPGDNVPVMLSMPVTFMRRIKVKQLIAQSRSVATVTTGNIEAIAFCDDATCRAMGGLESAGCQIGFFVTEGETPNVIGKTVNGGGAFTSIASPFTTATDDFSDVKCDGSLVVVANGTDTAYAYSWDAGASWSEVLTPTQVINRILIMGGAKVWMVAQGGYIYYSENRAASIITQDAGVATAQSLNDISASSALLLYAVGDNNAFVRTEDGGDIWTAVTGPAAGLANDDLYQVAAVPGTEIVLVGDEMGNVYRSEDKGDTWATVWSSSTATAGGIAGLEAPNCNVLAFVANDQDPYFYASPTGVMYQSTDGGASWVAVELPTNEGVRDLWACDVNTYWVVGDSGFVAKVAGPSI